MFSKAVKTEKSKSQAGTTRDSDKQNPGKSNTRLTADSPDAASLAAYQAMACNSPQAGQIAQMQAMANGFSAAQAEPKKENNTGLPDTLKTGIENLSGLSMDDVRVHYNSDKPAQLQALAYAQGTEIHVAPGQERHLPHEAWHVVQQMQGWVQPTMQLRGGVQVNDDAGLEKEADVMGGKASLSSAPQLHPNPANTSYCLNKPIQRYLGPTAFDTRKALILEHETEEPVILQKHVHVLRAEIPQVIGTELTPLANAVNSQSSPERGKGDGTKLLKEITDVLKNPRGGWADIQGYTRELSLGALYAQQFRLLNTRDSDNRAAKADAFWNNVGGLAAAQMKTILKVEGISEKENLPKAIEQINGKYKEVPPSGAAKVADIGVTATVDSERIREVDEMVRKVVNDALREYPIDAVRIWMTVSEKGAKRIGMLRQFGPDGNLTHEVEYPMPEFGTTEHAGSEFIFRGAPQEIPIRYPSTYPLKCKLGDFAKLGELADDATLLLTTYEDLEREKPTPVAKMVHDSGNEDSLSFDALGM